MDESKEYIWRSVGDEKARASHAERDGKTLLLGQRA